jgi:hypothetical protein
MGKKSKAVSDISAKSSPILTAKPLLIFDRSKKMIFWPISLRGSSQML